MFLYQPRQDLLQGVRLPSSQSYRERIRQLWDRMDRDSIAIFVANPEQTRSNDTEYAYRQNSDIVYLNGFPEPECLLVVSKIKNLRKVIMLVRPKDRVKEIWTGIRSGIEGARQNYLADEAHSIDRLIPVLQKLAGQAETIYYRFGVNPAVDAQFRRIWERRQQTLRNHNQILHEMRLIKSPEEIALMRRSCQISAEAHRQAMRHCRPGMSEGELQALYEYVFKVYGCTYPAYHCIVAAGNNAVILHYNENNKPVSDGELVLVDAGGEFGGTAGGYAADITRTFPAGGRFTEPQKEIYNLVLEAQLAAIAAARPGIRMIDVHDAASKVLLEGLKKLGILPETATLKPPRRKRTETAAVAPDGPRGEAAAAAPATGAAAKKARVKPLSLKDFYMHGTGHWLGLDVHDVGRYDHKVPNDRRGPRRRVLEPGMVITVEPGLYFDRADSRVAEKYRGIGVRIEDNVVITENGNEVLTGDVPKAVLEIESLMAAN